MTLGAAWGPGTWELTYLRNKVVKSNSSQPIQEKTNK